MLTQQIPVDLLRKSNKILFIAHLAIGDFSYLQNCFNSFSNAFPHLEMHLWVDELRRTNDSSQWSYLEKYALYDWINSGSLFSKVYQRTYSPDLLNESVKEAQSENYPIIVSLSNLRPHQYAVLARAISPNGFVAGVQNSVNLFKLHRLLAYRKLNFSIQPNRYAHEQPHISAVYADWFTQLFGIEITKAKRFPYVDIPEQWKHQAQQQLDLWGFSQKLHKIVFINPFAKVNKRCWQLEKIAELISEMQKQESWNSACFIVNAPPEKLVETREILEKYHLQRVQFFSAQQNFFELPAMLSLCHLIISVETAIMHLANAVHVPVIALMRQKNPEWAPFDIDNSKVITTMRRRDWVDAINVQAVLAQL